MFCHIHCSSLNDTVEAEAQEVERVVHAGFLLSTSHIRVCTMYRTQSHGKCYVAMKCVLTGHYVDVSVLVLVVRVVGVLRRDLHVSSAPLDLLGKDTQHFNLYVRNV